MAVLVGDSKRGENMFTRADYIAGKCTHRQYYAQFVSDATKETVIRTFTIARLSASKDEHFNDIPLHKWDMAPLIGNGISAKLKAGGDWLSMATKVCILKEAARQIVEDHQSK